MDQAEWSSWVLTLIIKNTFKTFLYFFLFLAASLILLAAWIWLQIPSEKQIKGCITTTMYEVRLCPGSANYVSLKKISQHLRRAVILTEDGSFFQHKGFDWEAIETNAKLNLEKGKYLKGGSTITQQLAKNMFLNKNKTLWRKAIEALIVLKIEKVLSKNEILERYLNVVEFGKNIYGVKQAAKYYFGKSAGDLNVLESAFLAMVLPSPIKYSRSFFSKDLTPFAKRRITRVVSDLYRTGRINESEYNTALLDLDYFLSDRKRPLPELGLTADEQKTSEEALSLEDLEAAEGKEEEL
ncbi:MAG: monofunctional biosynthetic peptidoglycan transglycosylase [Pseudobdellovibrionaceae bacterium]